MSDTTLYFEDLVEGSVFMSPGRTVTEADIVAFAGVSGDFNPIHLDAETAASNRYGQRVAHGLLGLSIATGLLDRIGVFGTSMVAMLQIDSWRFLAPIFIGETVRLELTILSTRLTASGTTGIVVRQLRLLGRDDKVLQEGTITVMIACRNPVRMAEAVD
jgi:acyl dehydratase